MKTHYYKDRTGNVRWKIVGRNGKIIGASTEGFSTFGKAKGNYDLVTLKSSLNPVEIAPNIRVRRTS